MPSLLPWRGQTCLETAAWGLVAGVLAAAGVLAFYTAMQNGPTSLVAPVSAAGVTIPVLGGIPAGDAPDGRAVAGVSALLAGVMVTALSHGGDGSGGPAVATPGRSVTAGTCSRRLRWARLSCKGPRWQR